MTARRAKPLASGKCPVCERRIPLRVDGSLWAHGRADAATWAKYKKCAGTLPRAGRGLEGRPMRRRFWVDSMAGEWHVIRDRNAPRRTWIVFRYRNHKLAVEVKNALNYAHERRQNAAGRRAA